MSVHHVHAWFTKRPEKDVRSLGVVVTGGFESPCGYWLRTEPRSSAKEASTLNCLAVSPAPVFLSCVYAYECTGDYSGLCDTLFQQTKRGTELERDSSVVKSVCCAIMRTTV